RITLFHGAPKVAELFVNAGKRNRSRPSSLPQAALGEPFKLLARLVGFACCKKRVPQSLTCVGFPRGIVQAMDQGGCPTQAVASAAEFVHVAPRFAEPEKRPALDTLILKLSGEGDDSLAGRG